MIDTISMILALLCGVALFMYGMSLMGDGLKSIAGNKLDEFLYRMSNTPIKGILLGTGVTSVIQSSSATAVMVIGFVNAGMMQLFQAISVIFGANIGTSVTGWILCLSYVQGTGGVAKLLSSSTIAAVVAIAGILIKMLAKHTSQKNLANIMMGFAILMTGMQMMSSAVSPLRDNAAFTSALTKLSNPVLGVLIGLIMTAILQSASASIGILQALSVTGVITFGTAFPVILGIGVGSSCPVLLSAIGASKNGQRASLVFLLNHVFSLLLWSVLFYGCNSIVHFPFIGETVGPVIIALINSVVRIVAAILLLPFIGRIEHLVKAIIKDSPEDLEDMADSADFDLLEERLLISPVLALGQTDRVINGMSRKVRKNTSRALRLIQEYTAKRYDKVNRKEDLIDKYESKLGAYLMQLTKQPLDSAQTRRVTMNLRLIGDLERIGDYASNIARIANEMQEESIQFSDEALHELNVMIAAENDIVSSTMQAYQENNLSLAMQTKPFSAAISHLCEILRSRHIGRMTRGECSMEQGNAFGDLLNSFEHIASHCVAISGVVRRAHQTNPDYHVHALKAAELSEEDYQELFNRFVNKYDVINPATQPPETEPED